MATTVSTRLCCAYWQIAMTRETERVISRAELARSDGEGGRPKYVAVAGRVYDVSDCPKWRASLHEQLHFPGQDLTLELSAAPHAAEVFTYPCVKPVGTLADWPSSALEKEGSP